MRLIAEAKDLAKADRGKIITASDKPACAVVIAVIYKIDRGIGNIIFIINEISETAKLKARNNFERISEDTYVDGRIKERKYTKY